jgi:hypothetical protein
LIRGCQGEVILFNRDPEDTAEKVVPGRFVLAKNGKPNLSLPSIADFFDGVHRGARLRGSKADASRAPRRTFPDQIGCADFQETSFGSRLN